MARLLFGNLEAFKSWLADHATPDRYEIYNTIKGEILAAPTKSTRSLHQAVMRFNDKEELGKLLKEYKDKGFRTYATDSIIWDIEKSPSQERTDE